MSGTDNSRLGKTLIDWYQINKRDLPWRDTLNPYIIWLSEVILQQTRVVQGYDYFIRFIKRFPTVESLASSSEEEVLKLWQGLGYYSRARNLHSAAKTVVEKYGGTFPTNYDDILSLKGIGEYTAAAIVSFAYNKPYPVVDGNVYRVLSRLFAIDTPIDSTLGKKEFYDIAYQMLDKKNPGIYNQAIMDFGALQCVPQSPECSFCPASDFCLAHINDEVKNLPVKQGKQKVKTLYFYYFDVRYMHYTYINRRTGTGIWRNLYEYPLIEADKEMNTEVLTNSYLFGELFADAGHVRLTRVTQMKHVLSHRIIHASFYRANIDNDLPNYKKIDIDTLNDYPVSRLMHKYISEHIDNEE